MSDCKENPLKIREIILNTRKPLVFKNFPINWQCFQDGIEAWCKSLDESIAGPLHFQRISKSDCLEPQWERKRKLVEISAMQFLDEHSKDCDYWSAMNYKRIVELPATCTKGIDFSPFGFSHAADDSTLWLGSPNANTPCHYDSYGCNVVVQVFGKKSWHLFPPNTYLTTTRIPYEESSVYCKENFYSPSQDMKKHLETNKALIYHVILEPNDVLIVPKHWWHYVEADNISLTVNTWIPLKYDLEQQIEECIVKYLIENFFQSSTSDTKSYVFNPNELRYLSSNDKLFEILKYLLDELLKNNFETEETRPVYGYHYLTESTTEELLSDFKGFSTISPISATQLKYSLKTRHAGDTKNEKEKASIGLLEESLLNSICSPHIIGAIRNEFVKRYKDK